MKNPKNIPRFRFTEDEPTPIVRDFKAFIDYTENTQFALGKGGKIPFKHLVALNELMSTPNRENTPRTPQHYYPRLHLFYHLSLAGSLFQKAQSGSSVVLEPAERLGDFRSLSDAGKYFFLLETLYVDCSLGVFASGSRREDSIGAVYGMRFFLEALSNMKPDKKASDVPNYAIVHPYSDEGPWADEILIGDLDLLVNQSILYLFDFGDEWTFDVNLLEIRTDEPPLPEAKITKKKGKSPEQYPYYEDF